MPKDRNESVQPGDEVRLKLFTFSAGAAKDVDEIDKVEIYRLFVLDQTEDNPLGRELVETVQGSSVVNDSTGEYHIDVDLDTETYVVGRYQDDWIHTFEEGLPETTSTYDFQVFPNRWFTDSKPILHDFTFNYTPTRIPKGSVKFIQIEIIPNVPRGTDRQRYYENIAADGILYISIEQKCGECMPAELDLRLLVDEVCVTEREGCFGFYKLDTSDTSDFECGIYNIWFKLTLGTNTYISDKQQIQIFQ